MIKCLKYLLLFLFFNLNIACEYIIITPSYNNIKWWRKNLDQSLSQKYKDYRIIFIDDCSPDGTGIKVSKYVNDLKSKNKLNVQIDVYLNNIRRGALNNLYRTIHSCKDDDIVVLVDGDDWLINNVFKRLDIEYKKNKKWLTYGQYIEHPSQRVGGACKYKKNINFRNQDFKATHLRTFYAGLFKKIKLKDLLDRNDKFYLMAWDVALMMPMMEMSNNNHSFIYDVLYVYNCINPLSDVHQNGVLQAKLDKKIRCKKPYKLINSLVKENEKYKSIKISCYDLEINKYLNNNEINKLGFENIFNFMRNTGINRCYIGNNINLESIGELVSPIDSNEKIYITRLKKINTKKQKYLLIRNNNHRNSDELILCFNQY